MAEYIDRDAIYTAFANACTDVLERASEIYYIAGFSYEHVIEILDDIPAADVAPVRHGRWDGDNCTVCKLPWNYNMTQDADDWGYFDPMPDYCPNCGAKMDER